MVNLLIKKRSFLVGIISLIFISSLFFSFSLQTKTVESSTNEGIISNPIITNWWNASWDFCTQVEITNPGILLTNHSVLITIPFYFDYENASDIGSDIRFTYQDNTTLLNHWTEEWDNMSNSIVWVKVPTLEAFTTKTILLYYGNPLAYDISNGSLVFDAFDDFSGPTLNENLWDVTTWAEGGTRNYGISDGQLNVNLTASGNGLLSGYQFKLKKNFTNENFNLVVKSSWQSLDYYKGFGVFNGPIITDNRSLDNYFSLALNGEDNVTLYDQIYGAPNYIDINDYSSGESLFNYEVLGEEFDFDISGTYNLGLYTYGTAIEIPFTIGLESLINGTDESDVSLRVYYDIIYLRNCTYFEPTATVIVKDVPDLYYPTITLISPAESGYYPPNQTISVSITDDKDGSIKIEYRWDAQFFVTFYIESNTIIEFYLPIEIGYHLLTIYAYDEANHMRINSFDFHTGEEGTPTFISTFNPTTIIFGYSVITTLSIISVGVFIIFYKTKRKRK